MSADDDNSSSSNNPTAAPLTIDEETVVKEELRAALAAYEALGVPPALLATMREVAEEAARTHPVARRLVAAAAQRAVPDVSGDLPKGKGKPSGGRAGGQGAP